MKKLLGILVLSSFMATSGCELENSRGKCAGLADERVAGVQYDFSVRNAVLGVIFFETIFAPIVWVATATHCPVE